MLHKVTGAGHCVCVCGVGGGGGQRVRVQWCIGGRRERAELPDSLMYESVLQSAGPGLETLQSPP